MFQCIFVNFLLAASFLLSQLLKKARGICDAWCLQPLLGHLSLIKLWVRRGGRSRSLTDNPSRSQQCALSWRGEDATSLQIRYSGTPGNQPGAHVAAGSPAGICLPQAIAHKSCACKVWLPVPGRIHVSPSWLACVPTPSRQPSCQGIQLAYTGHAEVCTRTGNISLAKFFPSSCY